MKALWFELGEASLREVPMPVRTSGESLLKLRVAGICNTDLELLKGYMGFAGVPGHEFVATVMDSDNADLVGRRVVGEINIPCGSCRLCHAGMGNHCPARRVLGISGHPGCLAEYFTLPDRNLHPLDDGVSDYDGVLAEPLAAGLRIADQTPVPDSILVVGDGKLGLLTAAALRRTGSRVWLAGHHEDHIEMLRPLEIYRDHGGLFPMVVDCTGNPDALDDILDRVEPQGKLVVKSTYAQSPAVDLSRVVVREITIIGSRCGPFAKAIELLRNPDVSKVLANVRQEVFPLEEALAALRVAAEKGKLKIMVEN
jgi:alcohol dehydrogenase